MPSMSDAFPSKYLKADVDVKDADDGGTTLTISGCDIELIGQGEDSEHKPVVYFQETDKGLVLNKTNAATLTALFRSDDSDAWMGQRIKLIATSVDFAGKMVRAIRVNPKLPAGPPPRTGRPAPARQAPPPDDYGDGDYGRQGEEG
jgi:hypothetical protein